MTDTKPRLGAGRRRTVQGIIALLIAIVIGFVVLRLLIDVPELAAGTLPEEERPSGSPTASRCRTISSSGS
jgi:hypothetical protein